MKKTEGLEYKESGFIGSSLDQVVTSLIISAAQGDYIHTNFNGVDLYGDTVSLNGAFLAITGRTHNEHLKFEKDNLEELKIKMKKDREMALSKIDKWILTGKELIPECKHSIWEEIVPVRAGDIYCGMELDNFIDIIRAWKMGQPNAAFELFQEAGHSWCSASILFHLLIELMPDGNEIADYLRREMT